MVTPSGLMAKPRTTKLQVRSVAELTRLAQAAGWFDERPPTFPKGQ